MDQLILWNQYWVWFALALILGILEIVMPGYILLGFALASAGIGLIFAGGIWPASVMVGSLPITLAIFGVVSLIIWLTLRYYFGRRNAQVKIWDKDINEN